MKVLVKVEKEVTHLFAEIGVRYLEDGYVNGEPDDESASKMPLMHGNVWRLTIDLATGNISGWPKGTTASVHYKVCDDGVYALIDADMKVVTKKYGYVPSMLCPGNHGYGDYVIMDIDGNGHISGWKADLGYFDGDDQ
jgi:hypothetical protein